MTTLESILKYFYLEKEVAKKPVDKFLDMVRKKHNREVIIIKQNIYLLAKGVV